MSKEERAEVGQRIRTIKTVERFPHFTIPSGATGMLTYVEETEIRAKMDDYIVGCEDWNNELIWVDELYEGEFEEDVELE